MANTHYLKTVVEDYVREELKKEFKRPFEKLVLDLENKGKREFDAVSSDGKIVCSIKSSGGRTSGGKFPSGKVNTLLAEVCYFMYLPRSAVKRYLILTDEKMYKLMKNKYGMFFNKDVVELKYIPLSEEIRKEVEVIQTNCSNEMKKEA